MEGKGLGPNALENHGSTKHTSLFPTKTPGSLTRADIDSRSPRRHAGSRAPGVSWLRGASPCLAGGVIWDAALQAAGSGVGLSSEMQGVAWVWHGCGTGVADGLILLSK